MDGKNARMRVLIDEIKGRLEKRGSIIIPVVDTTPRQLLNVEERRKRNR